MSLNFFDKLATFPPIVCRLLARRTQVNGKAVALTDEEIAAASGLSLTKVRSLSWLTSWDDVSVSELRAFSLACGVDFTSRDSMRAHRSYINNAPKFTYLRKHRDWRTFFEPMVRAYLSLA